MFQYVQKDYAVKTHTRYIYILYE